MALFKPIKCPCGLTGIAVVCGGFIYSKAALSQSVTLQLETRVSWEDILLVGVPPPLLGCVYSTQSVTLQSERAGSGRAATAGSGRECQPRI